MIAWLLWFFVALPLLILDGQLAAWAWPIPALTLAVCLDLSLFVRARSIPGLLVCTALARSVLLGGDAALHVLVLGIPIAVLVPLRALLFRGHLLLQVAAAVFLTVTMPDVAGLLDRLAPGGAPPLPASWSQLLWAAVVVPPATAVLRRLPPLSAFQDRSE